MNLSGITLRSFGIETQRELENGDFIYLDMESFGAWSMNVRFHSIAEEGPQPFLHCGTMWCTRDGNVSTRPGTLSGLQCDLWEKNVDRFAVKLTDVLFPLIRKEKILEARVGIEPTHKGFADLSLTTWVPRLGWAM